MQKTQFIIEQIVRIDRESQSDVVAATAKKHKESEHTIYRGQGTAHLPWTYYLLGPSNEQLAVWNGFAGAACGTTANTVRLWPVEYNVYAGGERTIVRPNGNRELVMSNHLGSTACIFPLTGVNRTPIAQQITDANGIPVTLQGAADPQRSRTSFIGRDVDKESDLGAFGARLYSSEYGRFVAVDKLWEEYDSHTSYHYAFSNPVATLDWNGLGPGDAFKSIRAAALDFAKSFNGPSIVNDREFISRIYSFNDGTNVVYSYTTPAIGTAHSATAGPEKFGTTSVSLIHTHGAESDAYADERPSKQDVSLVGEGDKHYVVTPGGLLLEYDSKGKTTLVSNKIPSDPKSPNRANGIDPVITNEPSMQGVPGLDVPYDVSASAQ